jgi:hypothetical protein
MSESLSSSHCFVSDSRYMSLVMDACDDTKCWLLAGRRRTRTTELPARLSGPNKSSVHEPTRGRRLRRLDLRGVGPGPDLIGRTRWVGGSCQSAPLAIFNTLSSHTGMSRQAHSYLEKIMALSTVSKIGRRLSLQGMSYPILENARSGKPRRCVFDICEGDRAYVPWSRSLLSCGQGRSGPRQRRTG